MFEFIFSFVKKMTFVSKGMAQKSVKSFASHICNAPKKCRKFCDGEQHFLGVCEGTLVCQQMYRDRCSNSSFLLWKNDFCIKRDGSKIGKIALCNVKCRKFCDGEQHVLVFVKVLWYANKCIVTDVRIHLFFCEKNDFCIKRDGSKIGKIAHLQCKM